MRIAINILYLCSLFSCDTVIWDGNIDDRPVVSCECPTGDLLAEHFARYSYTDRVSSLATVNRSIHCDPFPDWLLVGGSCSASPAGYNISLGHSGVIPDSLGYLWSCRWYDGNWVETTVTTSSLCVIPSATPDMPAECDCPPVQEFRDRIYALTSSAPFVPDTVDNTLAVTCEPGDVLLNGGCSTSFDVSALYLRLTSSGYDPENPDAWRCTWSHLGGPEIGTMTATAMCMRPPDPDHAPESEPLAERIIRRSTSEYLHASGELISSAPCLSDEYVLGGSCVLDHTEPASYEAVLNLFAYDPSVANAWRCGWYETANLATINSTATAMCLRPPEP